MNVSFLGLGNMGRHMARNLIRAGFEVTVWNRTPTNVNSLVAAGARPATTIDSAVCDADVVCLCLTADDAVKEVIAKACDWFKKGAIVIDHSTTSPGCAREMAGRLATAGCYFLDAPVSGGVKGAEEGTLTLMVGGEKPVFEKAEPIFKALGKNYHYLGPSGSGQTAKLINQLLTAVNQAVVCEAMHLAEKAGLDLKKLYEILLTSWGNSKMLERSVMDHIVPRNFESAACIELIVKDLNLTQIMADELGCPITITQTAKAYFDEANRLGMGRMDHSAIIRLMEK